MRKVLRPPPREHPFRTQMKDLCACMLGPLENLPSSESEGICSEPFYRYFAATLADMDAWDAMKGEGAHG
eukprot:5830677-Amphidinium_carterae.1